MSPEGTLRESASTAVWPAKRFVTRSTTTGSDMDDKARRPDVETSRRPEKLCGHSEQFPRLPERAYERVDVVHVIIDVEGSASRRRHAQPPHQRLRAVMTRANTDAVAVENRREIVRMHVAVREWNHSGAMLARAVHIHAFDLRKPFDRGLRQLLLMGRHVLLPECLEIGDGSGEPDGRLDVGCAPFELVGDAVPARAVIPDPFDHLPA